MLLPEAVTALNEIIAACVDAAAAYGELSERAPDASSRARALARAQERETWRAGIAKLVRELGELPDTRGTQTAPVKRLAATLAGALVGDEGVRAAEVAVAADRRIVERCEAARAQPLSDEARRLVESVGSAARV